MHIAYPRKYAPIQLFLFHCRLNTNKEHRLNLAKAVDQLTEDLNEFESIEELQLYLGRDNYENQLELERKLETYD